MEWLILIIFILSVVSGMFFIQIAELKQDLAWVKGDLNKAVDDAHKYAKESWEANDRLIDLTSENIELKNKLSAISKIISNNEVPLQNN